MNCRVTFFMNLFQDYLSQLVYIYFQTCLINIKLIYNQSALANRGVKYSLLVFGTLLCHQSFSSISLFPLCVCCMQIEIAGSVIPTVLPVLSCNQSRTVDSPLLLSVDLYCHWPRCRGQPLHPADNVTYPITWRMCSCNPTEDLIIKEQENDFVVFTSYCWFLEN